MSPQPTVARAHRAAARGVIALTVLSLLAPSAWAARPDSDAPRFAPAVWPSATPKDAFLRDRAFLHLKRGPNDAQAPQFRAPSADSCRRPARTHEEPGVDPLPTPTRGTIAMSRSAAVAESPAFATPAAPATPAAAATDAIAERHAESSAIARSGGAPAAMPAPPVSPVSPPASDKAEIAIAPGAPRANAAPVTAGMVDDNARFTDYLAYRGRTQVEHRTVDVRERVLLQVRDPQGRAVPDAEVMVRAASGAAMWARTDTAGRAWISPRAFNPQADRFYEATVRQGKAQSTAVFQIGQRSAVDVTLDAAAPAQRARLDLVFLIDATGSMADEIAKLKATLRTIADDVAALPSRPDTCFSLVAYRDITDAFLLRSHDFTNDLGTFQTVLDQLQADGGGDEPEAMNEALFEAVHALSWRGSGATRLMVLLADAPPHLDYAGPQYDATMKAALGKGIKVFSVGASGLNQQGEFIQRQIAQYTGGRFVFLTYRQASNPASGPGRETVHDVSNYSVETLDRLVVRLVSDELAQLPQPKR